MRVVFDSNVLVSAFALPGGSADRAVAAVLDGRVTLVLSRPIVGEVLGVLGRKFSRDTEELSRLAVFLADLAEVVDPSARLKVLADEPDNRVLECALEGGARLIVTGDRAMLALKEFQGIEIVTLRDFLGWVQTGG
jgi:putative PIN family toxin of toxin-antitoxin system